MYTKTVQEPWFTLIKLGLKTVEGRLNKGSFSNMKKGDTIIFVNNDFGIRKIKIRIKEIIYYNTFKEYLLMEKLISCLPGIDTINDGINVYYKYFTKEDEATFKIVAIRMKLKKLI